MVGVKTPRQLELENFRAMSDREKFIHLKYRDWRSQAKIRSIEFNITKEQISNLLIKQNNKCFYTNKELIFQRNSLYTVSLDRLDSNKPYSIDNVVICGQIINLMKLDLTIKEFKELIKALNKNINSW